MLQKEKDTALEIIKSGGVCRGVDCCWCLLSIRRSINFSPCNNCKDRDERLERIIDEYLHNGGDITDIVEALL
jgi:hypothetical protein